ncbi:hypothetical protein [Thermococcus sp. 5-4]|uniref:hypothetical protein n=1 Tax=Thermococcus sp. 5-4 TaxID=2008440 RepID=UPI000B497677|nr:hypothetical protein [Thermococcus sp. 5-4]ASA77752.1 hypothetical protein CDI07_05400 [Thermococcus sp. 5-4]
MLAGFAIVLISTVVGFGIALLLWRKNRYRTSVYGMLFSLSLASVWMLYFATLNPLRGEMIAGETAPGREIGLALLFAVYLDYLIAYLLVRNAGLTLHRAASWENNIGKITLFFSLVSVGLYPRLLGVYAVLYLVIGVWLLKNREEYIRNVTNAERLDLGWVKGFLRKYGIEVEEVYCVKDCFTALLTGKRLFIGERLLDFEPDETKVMVLEAAYVESRGIAVRQLILGLIVFLISGMVVADIGDWNLKLAGAAFLTLLSWGVDLAYIIQVRMATDQFVAGELGKETLQRTLKKVTELAKKNKGRDEFTTLANVEKRMKKV